MEGYWIRTLHCAFEEHFPKSEGYVVLSKADRDTTWRRSEFMHDLVVLKRHLVRSAYRERDIYVARKPLWQVESELSGDGQQVAIDFSKLIAGYSENKLMIVRRPVDHQHDGVERVKSFIDKAALDLEGRLFLAFLPSYGLKHPHLETYRKAEEPIPFELFVRNPSGTPTDSAVWRRLPIERPSPA